MVLPRLPYKFHDAAVTDVKQGPRHEVTLVVGLDDPDHPPHHQVYIRFGGIINFHEVTSFLEQVPKANSPDAYRARIDELDYDPSQRSKPGALVFRLVLDTLGQVLIRCRNVTVEADPREGR